jgi:hypothetical protein
MYKPVNAINWFIHVLPLEIQLFRGEDCDTINWFIHVLPLEIQLFRGEDCDTMMNGIEGLNL